MLGILTISLALRAWDLGRLSFWYDEVVTMRLAQAAGPGQLLGRLLQIDASRAPLHPLLIQAWLRLFGTSEAAARALSVLCGVVTVGLVWWIGRLAFDGRSGLWAAGLAAFSPPLVYYAREARMYALLVMVTCLCWGLLFSLRASDRDAASPGLSSWIGATRMPRYSLGVAALLYSHPLGLIMAGTLGLGSLLFVRSFFGTFRRWLATHLVALALAGPWLPHYFDHPPEFLSGRLPLRFLLGTPIGFIGGNSAVLLVVAGLIAFGFWRRSRSHANRDDWAGPVCLVLWLTLPPVLLYTYSLLGSPIFGPSRYTLFVAPAYLILAAQGLAMLPPFPRRGAALALLLIAILGLRATVYAPGLKADWRAFSAVLAARLANDPAGEVVVAVKSDAPGRNVEVETARYYLPDRCRIVDMNKWSENGIDDIVPGERRYVAIGSKSGSAPLPWPEDGLSGWVPDGPYPGLAVYRLLDRPRENPFPPRRSATSSPPGPG